MYYEIARRISKDLSSILAGITCVAGKRQGMKWLVDVEKNSEPELTKLLAAVPEGGLIKNLDDTFYIRYYTRKSRMIICGAGHVAMCVCELAAKCGFEVIVVDDRKEFLTKERFPLANKLICADFEKLSEMEEAKHAYFVILTRGHANDQLCLEKALLLNPVYIGVIGSKRKAAICKDSLIDSGYDKSIVDSVHTPIGLNINAKTPMEIAVSILGEIILQKNTNNLECLSEEILTYLNTNSKDEESKDVMTTIISKTGSAPRAEGTSMLVTSKGIYGTIGGGILEHKVWEYAKKANDMEIVKFSLDNDESAQEGMICGGAVEVLFEYL